MSKTSSSQRPRYTDENGYTVWGSPRATAERIQKVAQDKAKAARVEQIKRDMIEADHALTIKLGHSDGAAQRAQFNRKHKTSLE